MKDHEIAQTVNTLRDIAKEYASTEQLRERIAQFIVPLLKGTVEQTPVVHQPVEPASGKTIWERRLALQGARRRKQHELMDAWERCVYQPAMARVIKDCFAEGHTKGNFHTNGLGWSWWYCSKYGGRTGVTGPDDQTSPDDGDPSKRSKKED
jgi:hypothetical protein